MSGRPNALDPRFEETDDAIGARGVALGRQAGSRQLGLTLYELAPGGAVPPRQLWGYHYHHVDEEMLLVLAGTPSVRTPDGWRELSAGDVVSFPRGPAGAHQLANPGQTAARFLILSEMNAPKLAAHPDAEEPREGSRVSGANLLEPRFDDDEDTPGFAHRRARLGRQAGSEHLGASLYELGPGVAVCPYHWHAVEEELVVALSGPLSLRTTAGWRPLEPGEVVAFPVGREGAHQLANFGDEPARLLFLSQSSRVEVCGYPDSRKVMADALDEDLSLLWREADAVDYFEGEGPAGATVIEGPIGVVGAGTMGAGIAQVACLGGFEAVLHDPVDQALTAGEERIRRDLAKGAERGRWSEEEAAAAQRRLRLAPGEDELAGCDLVVEAAPEDLELKRALFARLAGLCGPDTVLATNTSSLSVTAIAAGVERPERVCGMHFFNPPALMRLVEVVAGDASDAGCLDAVEEVARRMGREPVRAADAIGFVANRCARPYSLEGLRLYGDGVSEPEQIDRIMRIGGGYRMGPFELTDLVGVDVNLEVAKSFWEQSFHEPRWRPHPIQAHMVAAGRLGRKAGRGYYDYGAGPHRPDDPPPAASWDSGAVADPNPERIEGDGFAAVNAEAMGLTELPREPEVVGYVALPDLARSRVVELVRGRATSDTALAGAGRHFAALDKHVECVLRAAPGLVLGRIVCQLVNEAHFAVAAGVADPADVDTALRLGLNHPRGPFEWCAAIGPERVVATLDALRHELGEERYRVAPTLRAAA